MTIKTLGILTSGGDTPGMNACINVIAKTALANGIIPFGIMKGYQGLIAGNITELQLMDVEGIGSKGGTILKTARCEEMKIKEGQIKAVNNLKENNIDALIVIGGDGSMLGAAVLAEMGIPTMVLPGTIDNDLAYTEFTIGFDTAVNCVIGEINRISDTMLSHERIAIVEVMGNKCGDIALHAGIASEVLYILVPEIPYDLNKIGNALIQKQSNGNCRNIIVMTEGTGDREKIAELLSVKTQLEIKTSVLGYVQRGGSPTLFDRMLSFKMGKHAVELLKGGQRNKAIGIRENKIIDTDILLAKEMRKEIDLKLYNAYAEINQ